MSKELGQNQQESMEPLDLFKQSVNKDKTIWTGSILDCLFHVETNKIFNFGQNTTLSFNHLFNIDKSFLHSHNYPRFKATMEKGLAEGKEFSKVLFSTFWYDFILEGFWFGVCFWSPIPTPFLTKWLLEWLNNPEAVDNSGYYYAAWLCVCYLLVPIGDAMVDNYIYRINITLDLNLKSFILERVLNISAGTAQNFSAGKVANMMSGDTEYIVNYTKSLNYIFTCSITIIAYSWFLFSQIGWIGLLAPITTALIALLQNKINYKVFGIKSKKTKITDKRAEKINETIMGIKSIKFNTMEMKLTQTVSELREQERPLIVGVFGWNSLVLSLANFLPIINGLICFWTIQLMSGRSLSSPEVYAILSVFNGISEPIRQILLSMERKIPGLVSMKRVEDLLKVSGKNQRRDNKELEVGSMVVRDGRFAWKLPEESEDDCKVDAQDKKLDGSTQDFLKGVDLEIQSGEFVGIYGKVGSGKTALLLAMMGEMVKTSGKVSKRGRVAYLSQEAFLVNETVRSNITFGKEFDRDLYDKAVRISQLGDDLIEFPAGDMTQIGERGINLSGGQKQRVAIARAVYSQADIYIIDDTLSALDMRVGSKVLEKVFKQELRDKTRIMVTHDLRLLSEFDRVILMKTGRLVTVLNSSEVLQSKEFKEFSVKDLQEYQPVQESPSKTKLIRKEEKANKNTNRKENDRALKHKGRLNKAEAKSKGGVQKNTIIFYFSKVGVPLSITCLIVFSASIASKMYTDYFVGVWMSQTYDPSDLTYPLIYLSLGILVAFLFVLRSIIYGKAVARAAILIFRQLFKNTLRRPMRFFDTTHSGQIINRCIGDTGEVDNHIPVCLLHCILTILSFSLTFVLMVILSPWNIIVVGGFTIYFYTNLLKFNKSMVEIVRMKKVSKSPLTGIANEMINGAVVIRQYGQFDFLWKRFKEGVNFYSVINSHRYFGHCWFTVRVKYSSALVVSLLVFIIALSKDVKLFSSMDANVLGLALTYLNSFMIIVPRLLWSCSETYRSFSSIERLMEYCTTKDHERDWDSPKPKKITWPEEGCIEFTNVKARYREGLPLVLKGVSFKVRPKEKVALVGRTGSGKSTIFLTLMRLVEIYSEHASDNCCISIDGQRIDLMGLHHLRKAICVIPQDPFLVEGTIRDNIDLFHAYSDEAVLAILRRVEFFETFSKADLHQKLKAAAQNTSNKYKTKTDANGDETFELNDLDLSLLDDQGSMMSSQDLLSFKVETKGQNLSLGQKQLICIARALLTTPKILLMDEATASIDQKTDEILQRVIREELKDTTLLTIAHRLNTIIHYDRVLILDNGVLAREGSPLELLNDSKEAENWFRDIVKESGEGFYNMMRNLAGAKGLNN